MAMPISNKRKADKNWAMERGSEALFSCSFGLHVPLIQNRLRRSKSPAKVNKNFQPNNLTIFLVKTKWISEQQTHCILTRVFVQPKNLTIFLVKTHHFLAVLGFFRWTCSCTWNDEEMLKRIQSWLTMCLLVIIDILHLERPSNSRRCHRR